MVDSETISKDKKFGSKYSSSQILFHNFIKSDKYPILIALGFLVICSSITFLYHPFWVDAEGDGIWFLHIGEEIIKGDGWNVKLHDAPPGGPVLYASLNSLFKDGFFTMKLISLLSGTGIVLFSYYSSRSGCRIFWFLQSIRKIFSYGWSHISWINWSPFR